MAAASLKPASVRVGRTPRRKADGSGPATLFYYAPKGKTAKAPVVLVYAMVNKPFILDLLPGRSVVETLRGAGHPVYLVDWGIPDAAAALRPLQSYVLADLGRFMKCVNARHPRRKPVLLGYCEGGVFSLLYAAMRPASVGALILLATPVDFSKMGTLAAWTAAGQFPVERLIDAFGNVPGSLLWQAFEALKPLASLRAEMDFLHRCPSMSPAAVEGYLAMEAWKREFVPHPGEAFRRVVKDLFQENRLMKGTLRLGRRRVDLGRIKAPALVLCGSRDHLVPAAASAPAAALLGSRARTIVYDAGHAGLTVSGRAQRELWPRVLRWIAAKEKSNGLA